MRTVALRFAENFAPDEGTIAAHEAVIEQLGFVWYGKMGAAVSQKAAADFERAIEQGYVADDRQSFQEYAEYVLDLKERSGAKHKTIESYRFLLAGSIPPSAL